MEEAREEKYKPERNPNGKLTSLFIPNAGIETYKEFKKKYPRRMGERLIFLMRDDLDYFKNLKEDEPELK